MSMRKYEEEAEGRRGIRGNEWWSEMRTMKTIKRKKRARLKIIHFNLPKKLKILPKRRTDWRKWAQVRKPREQEILALDFILRLHQVTKLKETPDKRLKERPKSDTQQDREPEQHKMWIKGIKKYKIKILQIWKNWKSVMKMLAITLRATKIRKIWYKMTMQRLIVIMKDRQN